MTRPVRKTIFLVHQNIPAQFRNLGPALVGDGYQVFFITNGIAESPGVTKVHYQIEVKDQSPDVAMFSYAQRVARAAVYLRNTQSVVPDLILGHVSWGEMMFLRDVYPTVPMVGYFEWFHPRDPFSSFDPTYETNPNAPFVFRTKNIPNYVCGDICDVGMTPTWWQHSTFPEPIGTKLRVIHDGTDTTNIRRPPDPKLLLPNGKTLTAQDEVVTYVSRSLEPVRGFPTAIRAIAELCRMRPKCQFVVIGRDQVSYGNPLQENDSWRARMLKEVSIDPQRVHFLGNVPYPTFLDALYVSSAHIYLTYPFILSWSMLEAMAAECLVFGSRTPPVEEVIVNGHNGILVDFHDHVALANNVSAALDRPDLFEPLRRAARQTILERYDLHGICLPRQKGLLRSLL